MTAAPRPPGTRVHAPEAGVRALVRIAWPVALCGLVTLFVQGNDTVLLAGTTDAALAAAAAATAVQTVVALTLAGLVSGGQILVARGVGAARPDQVASAERSTMWVGTWAGLTSAVVVGGGAPVLLVPLAGPAVDAEAAASYLMITSLALPAVGVGAAVRARLTGLGTTRGLALAAGVTAVVDVGAALALVGPMGPHGVAVGTVAGAWAGVAVLVRISRRVPATAARTRGGMAVALRRPEPAVREVLRLGWPEALLFAATSGAGVVVVWLLSESAPAELAAARFFTLVATSAVFVLLSACGTAATTLLSRAAGAEDDAAFRRVMRQCLLVCGAIAAVVLALVPWLYLPALGLVASADVVAASRGAVLLAFAPLPLMAAHTCAVAALRALRRPRTPMLAALVGEYVVFLPVAWALTRKADLGLTGVLLADLAYWPCCLLICAAHLRVVCRRQPPICNPAPGTSP